MSVNLYSFVENPFTNKAYFNYDKFKDVVYKAQRLMDDVIDLEEEKINKILNKIENDPEPEEIKSVERNLWAKIKTKLLEGRRTGLSAIGLADCLAAINVSYSSSKSIVMAEEIYKQFAIAAYKSSIDMGLERGVFPIYNFKLEKNNPYLLRVHTHLREDYRYLHDINGRRNIALLTIPPSGTISMMAGISSGIEPVYQLYYKRRYKILENTEEKKQYDFIDETGDKWREYYVFHPKFKEWCKLHDVDPDDLDEAAEISPYYKSTAYEIDPIQRVKLQGAIQKWIDHSISSTINLPEDISESDVKNIYFTAWKEGCKGITIYRNNSRTGVLVDVDKKDAKEFKQHDAPKRPKELECDVHHIMVKGKKIAVIVGLLENKPYEIFAIKVESDIIPSKGKGKLVKTSSGQYHIVNSTEGYFDIVIAMSDEEQAITRLVSTSLRHGANIKFVVEQLSKTHGDLTSFTKGIARALKTYIKDNEKSGKKCSECGSDLVYEGGCEICKHCGNSKCG